MARRNIFEQYRRTLTRCQESRLPLRCLMAGHALVDMYPGRSVAFGSDREASD